ncbi:MAG: hypothetical protein WBZ33_14455 [Thermoactinomyces sp.]
MMNILITGGDFCGIKGHKFCNYAFELKLKFEFGFRGINDLSKLTDYCQFEQNWAIYRVFVEEWNRTSHPKHSFYRDVDKYFGNRIESGISIIDDMIVDKSLDIEWFGINEEDLITGASHD